MASSAISCASLPLMKRPVPAATITIYRLERQDAASTTLHCIAAVVSAAVPPIVTHDGCCASCSCVSPSAADRRCAAPERAAMSSSSCGAC